MMAGMVEYNGYLEIAEGFGGEVVTGYSMRLPNGIGLSVLSEIGKEVLASNSISDWVIDY
jgi:hypothetical protein